MEPLSTPSRALQLLALNSVLESNIKFGPNPLARFRGISCTRPQFGLTKIYCESTIHIPQWWIKGETMTNPHSHEDKPVDNDASKRTTPSGATPGSESGDQGSQHSHKRASGQEVLDELSRLGEKFAEVVQVAWNSEQRRQIESDLRSGLNSVASSLEEGLKSVAKREETKEFVNKAEDVAESVTERVRSSKVAAELASGLAVGLRTVSEQLDKLAHDIQKQSPPAESDKRATPPSSTSEDIPITKE
jgi:hypothetical protein